MLLARVIAATVSALAVLVIPAAAPAAIGCACYDLVRVHTDGTHRTLLSRGASRHLEDVSRDLTKILFQRTLGVLEVSSIGGAGRHTVAGAPGASIPRARFSPDGTRVAYTTDVDVPCYRTSSIHVVGVDGSGERTIVPGCASGRELAWSPDGTRLAYVRGAQPPELVVHDLRTGAEHTVARGLVGDVAWSPADGRLAYAQVFRGGANLHVVTADGPRDAVVGFGQHPTWSPDGLRLAYQLSIGPGLAVVGADGSHRRVVDRREIDAYGWDVGWSPDSRRIVYRVRVKLRRGVTMALWAAHADGTHGHGVLTGVRGEELGPLFWTRGNTIVYGRYVDSGE